LFAPIPSWALVKRELLGGLRKQRTLWCLAVLILVLITAVGSSWPAGERLDPRAAGQVSRAFLWNVSFILMTACVLLVPGFAAAAVVAEREQDTLDVLRLSLIRPMGIVFAKLLNAIGLFLLLLVGALPILTAVLWLPGLDVTELVKVLVLLVTTTVTCASIGLASSSLFRRTFLAVIGAYVGMMAFVGLLVYPLMVMLAVLDRGYFSIYQFVRQAKEWSSFFSPFGALAAMHPRVGGSLEIKEMVSSFVYQVLWIALCLSIASRTFRRPERARKVDSRKPIDDPILLRTRQRTYPFYLLDPLRRKKPIEDGQNPVFVRELRWGLFKRGTTLVRVFYSALGLFFFGGTTAALLFYEKSQVAAWMAIVMALVAGIAPALVANMFTKEFELGNMDMIRCTLLSPQEIVSGKIQAGLLTLGPLVIAAAASAVPVLCLSAESWQVLLTGCISMAVCCVFAATTSLFGSLLTRRTSMALLLSYGLVAAFLLGSVAATPFLKSDDNTRTWPLSPVFVYLRNFKNHITDRPNFEVERVPIVSGYWLKNIATYCVLSCCFVWGSVGWFHAFRRQDR